MNNLNIFITSFILTAIAIVAFFLPFALILFAIYGIYKFIVWYNKKQRQPETNKRYALLNNLRNECEKHVNIINQSKNKEFIKDYQYLFNLVMYNDEEWIAFIEKKDGKDFYEYYQGFVNAVEFQSNRIK